MTLLSEPSSIDPRPVVAGRRVSPAIAEHLADNALQLDGILKDVSRHFTGAHVNADVVLSEIRRRLRPDAPVRTIHGTAGKPLKDLVLEALATLCDNELLSRDGKVMATDVTRVLVRDHGAFVTREQVAAVLNHEQDRVGIASDDLTGTRWYWPLETRS